MQKIMFTPIYILLNFLFHSFKAGLIILKSILLYSNIHFFLLDNEIFLLACAVTIVQCGFLVGIIKFPSFMFKHNSNIAFNSSGLAFLNSSPINTSPHWRISKNTICFSMLDWGSVVITSVPTILPWINHFLSCPQIPWTPFRCWLRFTIPGCWQIGHVRGSFLGISYQCYLYQVNATIITSINGVNNYR